MRFAIEVALVLVGTRAPPARMECAMRHILLTAHIEWELVVHLLKKKKKYN